MRVFQWIVGVLLLITAFSGLVSGDVTPALLFAVVGLCILPAPWSALASRNLNVPVGFRWVAGVVAFAVAGTLLGAEPNAKAGSQNATGKAVVSEAPPQAAPPQPVDQATKNRQAKQLISDLSDVTDPCDQFGKAIGDAFGNYDMMSAYENATNAEGVCYDASSRIESLALPAYLSDDGRKDVKAALSDLSEAYSMKAYTYKGMAKVADGNMKPSMVSDVKSRQEMATAGQLSGLAKLMTVLVREGAEMKAFSDGKD